MTKITLFALSIVLSVFSYFVLLQPLNLYLIHAFNYQLSLVTFILLSMFLYLIQFDRNTLLLIEIIKRDPKINDKDQMIADCSIILFKILAGLVMWLIMYLYYS